MANDSNAGQTKTGRLYVTVAATFMLLLAVIVFAAQNSDPVKVSYLGWNGDFPLGLALLLAMTVGALTVVLFSSARVLQLRRRIHRGGRRSTISTSATKQGDMSVVDDQSAGQRGMT